MDFLPVQRTTTNKVDTAINLANDGGSKSNTGYFSSRGGSNEEKPTESSGDEVNFSKNHVDEEELEEELNFAEKIIGNLTKLKEFILKIFGQKKQKVYNIYEQSAE